MVKMKRTGLILLLKSEYLRRLMRIGALKAVLVTQTL